MTWLLQVLLATLADSAVALVGAAVLKVKNLERTSSLLAAFAAGALLVGGMAHLFAESLERTETDVAVLFFLTGFSVFFLLEFFLKWHKCGCKAEPFTYMILLADGVHNFFDGVIIGASFLVSPLFGWITTGLIILHEVPQELGDFGILVQGGFKPANALVYNFVSQLSCVFGGLLGWFAIVGVVPQALAFSAGGFIYISAADLVPRMKDKRAVTAFFAGLVLLEAVKIVL